MISFPLLFIIASAVPRPLRRGSCTAYGRRVDGRELNFELRQGKLMGRETGSEWNLFGTCVACRLKGKQLEKPDSGVHIAFAWLAFNPQSQIYRGEAN